MDEINDLEVIGDAREEFEQWLDENEGEDLPVEEDFDDYMDGDHESALESVYGPND